MKTFRTLVAMVLSLVFLAGTFQISAVADEPDYLKKLDIEKSIKQLEKLDIVRNPLERWNENDYISRRDMFKFVYIIRSGSKKLFEDGSEDGIGGAEEAIRSIERHKEYDFINQTEYIDVEIGTDDYFLIDSLLRFCLISGIESTDGYKADFNSYATYEQALTVIGRLFDNERGRVMYGLYIIQELVNKTEAHPYFAFACDIGLINSKSPIDLSSPKILVEQLDDPITAYEYMQLLYRALFIPTFVETSFGVIANYRYIEKFSALDLDRDFSEETDIWQ